MKPGVGTRTTAEWPVSQRRTFFYKLIDIFVYIGIILIVYFF